MRLARRIPLNPCDYLYYTFHVVMEEQRQRANVAYMVMDAHGYTDPNRVRRALAAAMCRHPVTMSGIRLALTTGRPYWKTPSRPAELAPIAASQAFTFDDIRADPDWQQRLDSLCVARQDADWDLATGPQVRLEQYALPNNRTRFCLRWPHLVMDAEGAQWFLTQLSRCDRADDSPSAGNEPLPKGLIPDDQPIPVLAGTSLFRRLKMFRQGFAFQGQYRHLKIRSLIDTPLPPISSNRLLHRCWEAGEVQQIQANAKRLTPPGPALYARFLASCVLRSLNRIYNDAGKQTEAYLIPLPLSVLSAGRSSTEPMARPVPGNYLVSPILCATREAVEDRARLGADLLAQLLDYQKNKTHLIQWTMVWMAANMSARQYQWVIKRPIGFEAMASGFSYYGEISPPLRAVGGLTVTNLWGAGPVPVPPGWNPVFSRFGDRLNMSLTYSYPSISDELARRYVSLIDQESLHPA
jgi:hypothetical protein